MVQPHGEKGLPVRRDQPPIALALPESEETFRLDLGGLNCCSGAGRKPPQVQSGSHGQAALEEASTIDGVAHGTRKHQAPFPACKRNPNKNEASPDRPLETNHQMTHKKSPVRTRRLDATRIKAEALPARPLEREPVSGDLAFCPFGVLEQGSTAARPAGIGYAVAVPGGTSKKRTVRQSRWGETPSSPLQCLGGTIRW